MKPEKPQLDVRLSPVPTKTEQQQIKRWRTEARKAHKPFEHVVVTPRSVIAVSQPNAKLLEALLPRVVSYGSATRTRWWDVRLSVMPNNERVRQIACALDEGEISGWRVEQKAPDVYRVIAYKSCLVNTNDGTAYRSAEEI